MLDAPTIDTLSFSGWVSSFAIVLYVFFGLFLRVRPNYIHSASNYIHTDGPTATARARG